MLDGRVQLAAVVINYKTPDLVLQCVSSLLSQLDSGKLPNSRCR